MPVSRGHAAVPIIPVSANAVGPIGAEGADAGDGEGDGDDRVYCICNGISYGEMIACDDSQCEKEWVCACGLLLFCSWLTTCPISSI